MWTLLIINFRYDGQALKVLDSLLVPDSLIPVAVPNFRFLPLMWF